jgi:hypothetical protein
VGSEGRPGMPAFGAARPLRLTPAIVSFLNPQRALSLGGANRSSCPSRDICQRSRASRECRQSAAPVSTRELKASANKDK